MLDFPSIQSRLDSASEVLSSFLWTKQQGHIICRGKSVSVITVQQVACPTWPIHPCNPRNEAGSVTSQGIRNSYKTHLTLVETHCGVLIGVRVFAMDHLHVEDCPDENHTGESRRVVVER